MTKKRFTVIYDDIIDLGSIYDSQTEIYHAIGTLTRTESMCKLLNKLNDDNVELYIQNDFLKDENQHMRELVNENKQLKQELQRIYDAATLKKARDIVDKVYDDLLYETSGKSDYAREKVFECLEKLDEFGDDLE